MGKAKSSQVLAYGERRKLKNESKYLERERDPKRRDHNLFFFSLFVKPSNFGADAKRT